MARFYFGWLSLEKVTGVLVDKKVSPRTVDKKKMFIKKNKNVKFVFSQKVLFEFRLVSLFHA